MLWRVLGITTIRSQKLPHQLSPTSAVKVAMTKPLGQKHSPTGLLIPGHSTDLVYFQSKLCSATGARLQWNHKGTERWIYLYPLKSWKGNYLSKIQKTAGLIVCDNTLLWRHWPRFMQPTEETWTCPDDSRSGNTAAHGAAEKGMCLSHATKFQRNGETVVPTRYRNKVEETISVLCHWRAK